MGVFVPQEEVVNTETVSAEVVVEATEEKTDETIGAVEETEAK